MDILASTSSNIFTPSFKNVAHLGSNCGSCAMHRICQGASLLNDVPEEVRGQLFHSRVIKAKKHLFRAGDDLTALYAIKSGGFKTYMSVVSGDEYVVNFPMTGDVLGADGIGTRKHEFSAIALTDSAVCIIPIKKLESVTKHYSSDWLLKQACQSTLRDSYKFLLSVRSNLDSYGKVASFLIDQADSYKARGFSGKEFRLNMTRGDIANYLGCKLETVSRALHRMKDENILTVRGRYITVNDLHKLQRLTEPHEPLQLLSA